MAPLALVMVHLGKPWLADWVGLSHASWVLYFVPVAILVQAFLSVANIAAIRQELYVAKAEAYVGSTLLTNLGKLTGGLLAPSSLLLIIITLAGAVANVIIQLFRVRRRGALMVQNWFGLRGITMAARSYKDFCIYKMPQGVLRASILGLPTILLSVLFGSAAAGQYSLAITILGAPVGLIGQAVGDVFLPTITRAINRGSRDAHILLMRATLGMAIASLPFCVLIFWGDLILPLVFGTEWALAGDYIQWLTVWLSCTLISYPAISAFPALRLQSFQLKIEVLYIGLSFAAMYIGFSWYGSDIAAIALFSLVGSLTNMALICMAHKAVYANVRKLSSSSNNHA
ncbi:oligosaccharide flippase family protein [Novosphingobium panipatense]